MTPFARLSYLLALAVTTGVVACSNSTNTGVKEIAGVADASLSGRTLKIEDLSGRGIIDNSNIRLIFGTDGQVSGSAGCNALFGRYQQAGADLEFSQLGTTRKLCPPALMNQEQAVVDVLSAVTRIERGEDGALILRTDDGRSLRGFESTRSTVQSYRCDDGATLEVRYPTQHAARIVHQGQTLDMTLARSASGARYTGSGWEWWSKGRLQASLAPLADGGRIVPERRVTCRLDVSAAPDSQVVS